MNFMTSRVVSLRAEEQAYEKPDNDHCSEYDHIETNEPRQ